MGLEIEFDYDDTQGGVWSPALEAPPLRERVGRRWNAGLSAGSPAFVHLGIALAALALGAASTAGYLDGKAAARDRTITRLHLAPVDAFVVEPLNLPQPASAQDLLATPWTNAFDQHVALSVVNDGPDPVTVLSAQVTAPQFGTVNLAPLATSRGAAPASTAPGKVGSLHGMAHIVCGDYSSIDPAATVARLTVRTSDGRTRVQTLMVDRFSDIQEAAVCAVMPGPQVVTSTSTALSNTPGTYTYNVKVANRAPYPLLMTVPSNVIQDWQSAAGLVVEAPSPVTIPAHGSSSVAIPVTISSCTLALESVSYGFDTLAFVDARDGPDDPLARESDQSLLLDDQSVVKPYCGPLELPGINGGGNGN